MKRDTFKNLFANKTFRLMLILFAALLLLLVVWKVFFGSSKISAETEHEQRLAALLQTIDGVECISVLVGEENGVPVNAVIVIGGEESLLARSRVADVASAALMLEKSKISVYPAKG